MNSKIKSMLVLLVLMVMGLPLLMKGPDGKPIMTWRDWLPDTSSIPVDKASINQVVDQLQHISAPAETAGGSMPKLESDTGGVTTLQTPTSFSTGSGKMYKWQDEKGRWHFSNQKPMAASQVSMEELPEVENVMEAPVNKGDNSSSIRLPGGFGLGGQ